MIPARLQAGQAQLVQPSGDGVPVGLHPEPPLHLRLQVHAAPANHAVDFRIGAGTHESQQLRPLQAAQSPRPARRAARHKALHALGIVAVDPVPQGLAVHAVQFRSLRAGPTLQNHRHGKDTPNLRTIGTLAAQGASLPLVKSVRVIATGAPIKASSIPIESKSGDVEKPP